MNPSPTPAPSPSLDHILARLKQARRAAIFTHLRPDPDALGSQAAAACILKNLGQVQEIQLLQFADAPPPYRFLQQDLPASITMWTPEWAADAGQKIDTFLLVDTCTYQQLEPATAFLKAHHDRVVAIDHHASRDDIGPHEFLFTDTSAAACVEILWRLAGAAAITPDATMAQALYAGLVGDTGWFRFDSVTSITHQMAAQLLSHINPAALYERLMQNESRTKLALMQRTLAAVRWSFNDRYACMILRHADFTETGATASQTEYLVDMPMMVSTVEVVALMTEMADGRIRTSLRSKHDINVNKICNQFGGGGHAKAAGCRLDGPLETAITRLETAVGAALSI